MRRNVLDWICGRMKDATSATILTHNIDFLFLQAILRPRLRRCGHPKLTVFADATCAAGSYDQQHALLEGIGRHYRVVPVDMGPGRRFHPKAILLAGPTRAALAVGSGNLTHGGWSANREIWATYDSGDGGLPALAAFRTYLEVVLGLVLQPEVITDEVMAPFDPHLNTWAASLPTAAGLEGTPSDQALLDRLVELAGPDTQSVTLCAPYYDPDGVALAAVGSRFPVPVEALLQRNHVGLARSAAASRPANVSLVTVDTDPPRFIHAKLFVFRRRDSALLVAGSANISRAALMAGRAWGNAELVAAQEVPLREIDELLADLERADEDPVLPEDAPSEGWDLPSAPVRILVARFVDGTLHVTFKADVLPQDLEIELDDGRRLAPIVSTTTGTVRLALSKCPRFIRLHGRMSDGSDVVSTAAWVDDEASLNVSVPERRLAAKVAEIAESGSLSAGGMFEILQILHQHLEHPTRKIAGQSSAPKTTSSNAGPTYSIEDVFSTSFGRPQSSPISSYVGCYREEDFFQAFSAYFFVDDSVGSLEPADDSVLSDDDETAQDLETEKARKELEQRQATRRRVEEGVYLRGKLIGALEKVIHAMSAEAFVASRPPQRLGADIAATALLLRKGVTDGFLSGDDFLSVTHRLWAVLFFGANGQPGAITRRIQDTATTTGTLDGMASPRLSAALTLWCFPDWQEAATESARFRMMAGLLAADMPWLIAGGAPEEVAAELQRLARVLPTSAGVDSLFMAWRNWLQAGAALTEFRNAVRPETAGELAARVSTMEISRGELLWQNGEFFLAKEACRREIKIKATVLPLDGSAPKRFVGSWLVPVPALLMGPNPIEMNEAARQQLLSMTSELRALSTKAHAFV